MDLLYQWSTLTTGSFPAQSTRSCTMRSQRSSGTRSGKLCLVATWIVVPPHFQPTPPHQCPLSQPRDQGGFLIANRKNVFQRITTPTLFFSTACALVLITVLGVFIHPVTHPSHILHRSTFTHSKSTLTFPNNTCRHTYILHILTLLIYYI